MTIRETLSEWIVEALHHHNGKAKLLDISRHIWEHHQSDLERMGDEFYRWQYDIRWAGKVLRENGVLKPASDCEKGVWELTDRI